MRRHQVRSEEWVHHTLLESPHQWILVQNSSGISSYPAALAASGPEIDAQTINKPQKTNKKRAWMYALQLSVEILASSPGHSQILS